MVLIPKKIFTVVMGQKQEKHERTTVENKGKPEHAGVKFELAFGKLVFD